MVLYTHDHAFIALTMAPALRSKKLKADLDALKRGPSQDLVTTIVRLEEYQSVHCISFFLAFQSRVLFGVHRLTVTSRILYLANNLAISS
jgi:hypothetical protein